MKDIRMRAFKTRPGVNSLQQPRRNMANVGNKHGNRAPDQNTIGGVSFSLQLSPIFQYCASPCAMRKIKIR
jgi:hypothetical protein